MWVWLLLRRLTGAETIGKADIINGNITSIVYTSYTLKCNLRKEQLAWHWTIYLQIFMSFLSMVKELVCTWTIFHLLIEVFVTCQLQTMTYHNIEKDLHMTDKLFQKLFYILKMIKIKSDNGNDFYEASELWPNPNLDYILHWCFLIIFKPIDIK